MLSEKGKFIISLDFELHWGIFDSLNDSYKDNLRGTRNAIQKILELFQKYDISATWATVGMLFNKNVEDYKKHKPINLPTYKNKKLNSYEIKIGQNEEDDPFHYGYNVIKLILSYENQEIGSHSYSHFYCKEIGQDSEQFEDDIRSAVLVAKNNFDIKLRSFVFPKNAVNEKYLKILKKYEFTHFRGTGDNYIYRNGHKIPKIVRIIRLFDSFINITGFNVEKSRTNQELIDCVGNRFLRPYYKNWLLNKLMLKRIKKEMKYAAEKNLNYHLWWHPHNFGKNTFENLNNLNEILNYFIYLKKEYGMESVCMKEIF